METPTIEFLRYKYLNSMHKNMICFYEYYHGKCWNNNCPYNHIIQNNYLTMLENVMNSDGETIYFTIKNKILKIKPCISYIQLILYGFKLYKIDQNIIKTYNIFINALNIFINSTNNQYFNHPLYNDLIYIINKLQYEYNYSLYVNNLILQMNSIPKKVFNESIKYHIINSLKDIIKDDVFLDEIYKNLSKPNNIILNKTFNWADCDTSSED